MSFFAGVLAFAMTATQAVRLDAEKDIFDALFAAQEGSVTETKPAHKEQSADDIIKKMMSPSKEEKQIKVIKKELEKGKAPHIDPPKKKKTTTAAGTKKPTEAAAAEEE